MTFRIAVFIGTRPEAIKLAPVVRALEKAEGLEPVVVCTGQHQQMLQQVIDLFAIPVHYHLDVMADNQSLADLSARLLQKVDSFLAEENPDFALVQGDTTSALTSALACFYRKVPVGHVEAGLRTGNLQSPFPEEANRKLVTTLADLHFPPTQWAADNLRAERVGENRILITGNTVIDALHLECAAQEHDSTKAEIDTALCGPLGADWREHTYVLVTGHRRESFGDGFEQICSALRILSERFPKVRFVYPVHLNPRVCGPVMDRLADLENIFLLEPLAYRPFVALMKHAKFVLTDSGGVQEEAPGLGKPVLVMRDHTERPEGVKAGTVRLVAADANKIIDGVSELLLDSNKYEKMSAPHNPYGDGKAAQRIVAALKTWFSSSDRSL
jgi:UDP-N-acetylglucosamine 2-epimerase (non-hydrolysing)